MTGKQITQLQLNGRNFTQLVTLVPGVSNQTGAGRGTVGISATVGYSINGGRTEYNNWEIDGGDNMDNGSNTTLNVYPSLDAIGEVQSPHFQLRSAVRSQRFRHHRSRDQVRNQQVPRRSSTNSSAMTISMRAIIFAPDIPTYKKNDFGYTIGGPVYIPGVYNKSKEKTFFFFSQEWRKEINPTTFNVPVPSCVERGLQPGAGDVGCTGTQAAFGDFSEPCNLPPPNGPVDCPIIPNGPSQGSFFANNQVPIDMDPTHGAVPLLAMFPFPNSHDADNAQWSFNDSTSTPTYWREELFKIDHNINSKLHASVRYIHDSWNSVSPVPLWTNGGSYPTIQDCLRAALDQPRDSPHGHGRVRPCSMNLWPAIPRITLRFRTRVHGRDPTATTLVFSRMASAAGSCLESDWAAVPCSTVLARMPGMFPTARSTRTQAIPTATT